MTKYRLVHLPTQQVVATVSRADTWWQRGWGVLGQKSLPAGQGLWLPGVASVHTLGVRFALDLLFLDKHMQTLRLAPDTAPGRWLVRAAGAVHTLELGAGTLPASAFSAQLQTRLGDGWYLEKSA